MHVVVVSLGGFPGWLCSCSIHATADRQAPRRPRSDLRGLHIVAAARMRLLCGVCRGAL